MEVDATSAELRGCCDKRQIESWYFMRCIAVLCDLIGEDGIVMRTERTLQNVREIPV